MEKSAGFTLLEVVIAMCVLAVGLLGLASLQTVSLKSSSGGLYRFQAAELASSIVDAMRANRSNAAAYTQNNALSPAPSCQSGTNPPLSLTGTIPQQDVTEWRNTVACNLPQGTGSVEINGGIVTVTVQWLGSREQTAAEHSSGQPTTQSIVMATDL